MKKAPEGVGWGTTNTPKSKRIDPNKAYRTRRHQLIIGLEIQLANSNGNEVTFPVKGSVVMGKGKKPMYTIWTLDGKHDLFQDTDLDLVEIKA